MDRPAVGLRLPRLPILIAAFWAVMSSRQLQTFIPVMSEERTIPMQFNRIRDVTRGFIAPSFDIGILALLTNTDNPFLSTAVIYSIELVM